jgi:hypothetical protein
LIGSDIYRYGDVTPSSEQKGVFHAADNAYRLVFGAHLVPQLAVVSALVICYGWLSDVVDDSHRRLRLQSPRIVHMVV